MANEWNNFFNELFDAGANVYQGVQIGGMKKDAERTYKTAMKNIDSIIKLSPTGQQNQEESMKEEATLNSFFDGFNPGSNLSENINNMQSATLTDVPVIPERKINTPGMNTEEDLLKVFLDATAKLGGLGEYGEPYIKPLGAYYESKVPKGPVTKTDVTNGFVIKYDSDGNILKKTKIDDLPKQEKNTVMKYSKMTYDEALNLQDNELTGDAFFYLPKDVQLKLMEQFPALQQLHDKKFEEGDYAPSSNRRFSSSKKRGNLKDQDSQGENDIEKTASDLTDLMSLANTRDLTVDEENKLYDLKEKVESNIRTMREKSTSKGNDIDNFVNSVLKSWGRTDPSSIPPEEWAREILEESWDDNEWEQIKSEFQRLTGSSIEKYMK